MNPGPNRILRTPATGALAKISTIISGNTFGAVFWTDGKREAPMLPDSPWLRLHPATGELLWTDECEVVGEEWPPGSAASEFAEVPYAEEPTIDDYSRALTGGVAWPPEKERYIRMRLWWAVNDPVRRGESSEPTWPDHRENLAKLLELVSDSDPNQRLMAAEICRELGEFERAAELLKFEFPKEFETSVRRIQTLTAQKDSLVRQVR